MITEHNFQKIYLLQIDTPSGPRWLGGRIDIGLLPTTEERLAVCFPLTEDANSLALVYLTHKAFRSILKTQ
jgi:hypothetical protein